MKLNEIKNYFEEICYGVKVEELWEKGNKKYFAVMEMHPFGEEDVFIIYSQNGRIYNENGDDIIELNEEF